MLLAAGAVLSETSFWQRASLKPAFRIGAPVVYRQQEVSTCPTADARDVHPAERGEYYYYTVINYLRVAEVMADGRIIAVARNNKRLCFWPNDSGLRKARLAERLIYRPRFPRLAIIQARVDNPDDCIIVGSKPHFGLRRQSEATTALSTAVISGALNAR